MGKDEWLALGPTKELIHNLEASREMVKEKIANGVEDYRMYVGYCGALATIIDLIHELPEAEDA